MTSGFKILNRKWARESEEERENKKPVWFMHCWYKIQLYQTVCLSDEITRTWNDVKDNNLQCTQHFPWNATKKHIRIYVQTLSASTVACSTIWFNVSGGKARFGIGFFFCCMQLEWNASVDIIFSANKFISVRDARANHQSTNFVQCFRFGFEFESEVLVFNSIVHPISNQTVSHWKFNSETNTETETKSEEGTKKKITKQIQTQCTQLLAGNWSNWTLHIWNMKQFIIELKCTTVWYFHWSIAILPNFI